MPTIHLGVYLTSGKETYQAVRWALEVCWPPFLAAAPSDATCTHILRLAIEGKVTSLSALVELLTTVGANSIDSAQMYRNEKESGQAILDFLSSDANTDSLKRDDIHFTSKLASNSSYDTARTAIKKSVKECGLGYIDLFLLHSPYGGKNARLESWRAVEDAIDDGEIRIGGVSNYGVKHVSSPRFVYSPPKPCMRHSVNASLPPCSVRDSSAKFEQAKTMLPFVRVRTEREGLVEAI
jgi:hypothetical protein